MKLNLTGLHNEAIMGHGLDRNDGILFFYG